MVIRLFSSMNIHGCFLQYQCTWELSPGVISKMTVHEGCLQYDYMGYLQYDYMGYPQNAYMGLTLV